MTRAPLPRPDSARCSARSRHRVQVRNSGSPSRYALVVLSNMRGVDATVIRLRAVPDGVMRSPGASTRLPTRVMAVSFTTGGCPFRTVDGVDRERGGVRPAGQSRGEHRGDLLGVAV